MSRWVIADSPSDSQVNVPGGIDVVEPTFRRSQRWPLSSSRASSLGFCARFVEFTNEYPWRWRANDVDQFLAELRSQATPIALSTLRSYSNAISMFCSYVSDSRYGWVDFCEKQFRDVPSQIVFEWNTPQHTTDDADPPGRRAFTKADLQHLFDIVDDFVDEAHSRGSKRWLTALRDSTAFKIGYAFGLRRRELVMLDITDFGPNPHVPRYGNFGALTVRWAKGTKGSGPRRRTVLTSPEFPWAVDLLQYWCSEGRQLFATADRSPALWPSERGDRLTLGALGRSFTSFRRLAGLPPELSLHALRHSYTTHLLEAGYDPLFVQQQFGHSYASTTSLYTSVSSDFKQRVILDLWQSTGPTTREHIARFIRWAIKSRLIPADLEVTPHRRGTAPQMPITEQNAVIEKVAHQQTLHPRDRLAAILVIVFAQRMEDVAVLTWDRVTITAEAATITLADTPIELPPPLDEPLRALAAGNYNKQTAAHPKSPWIFRGYRPGMHLTPTHLRNHLRPVLASLEARLGTLNELTQTTPIAILAETLGYSPQTLEAHARASASTYARYIATRLDDVE